MQQTKMTVFETTLSNEELRKLILRKNRTLAPRGSGGYSIRRTTKSSFRLTERERTSPKSFEVWTRQGCVWTPADLAPFFEDLLIDAGISFVNEPKTFASRDEARQAFEICVVCKTEKAFHGGLNFDKCLSCARGTRDNLRDKLINALSEEQRALFTRYDTASKDFYSMGVSD